MLVLKVLAGVMALAIAVPATAEADDVLNGERARNPLTALIGIPDSPARRSTEQTLHTRLLHGNSFVGGTSGDESLFLDGATTELGLSWFQPLTRCLGVSARLPLVVHGGGVFDNAIESFHDIFGLPNGGRENAPSNELMFEHVVGDEVFALSSSGEGIGDVSVWVRGLSACENTQQFVAWRVGVKLPTGDEDEWLGSGGTDLWADVQSRVYQPIRSIQLAASAGVVVPGETDVLPTLQSVAFYGSAGARFSITPRLVATLSFDWHTALFDSELIEIGELAGQLTTGLRFGATSSTAIDLQFTEDILVDTVTDIAVRIAVTTRFGNSR